MIVLEIILLSYFFYVALYTIIFAIGGLFYKGSTVNSLELNSIQPKKCFGVFIPGYKEDSVIVDVAKNALKQNFPSENYDVIIIADSFQATTLDELRKLAIKVFEVKFDESTKVKALNKAFEKYAEGYEYAVILDADNLMEPSFLNKMYSLHKMGYSAIQGKRAAKNSENSMAFLDGLSEAINTHIFCKGSNALNMSASLKGSGMSFEFNKLRQLLGTMNSVGGFDRELEIKFIENNVKVIYEDSAIIYDEKTSNSSAFNKQRKRWVASQYVYLKKYFLKGLQELFTNFNLTYFNSAVLRNIQLPRLINLGLIFIFALLAFALPSFSNLKFSQYLWLSILIVTYTGVLISIPRKYFSIQLLKALFSLPLIFINMIKILFGLKNANKRFIHTPHSS